MPFLKFEAQDNTGRIVTGTLQAANQQELDAILAKQGLRRVQGNPAPVAPKPKVNVQPIRTAAAPIAQARESVVAQAKQTAVAVAAAPLLPKSFGIRHKQLFFLFSQMASFARSGFGPADGLQRCTQRFHQRYQPMLAAMISGLSNGRSLSDVMGEYPRSFSPDMVNTVKSGEMSGQVPQALEMLAEHEQKQSRMLIPIFYFLFMFPLILFMGISIFGIIKASGATMIRQDQNNSSLPPIKTLFEEFLKNAPSYYAWAIGAVILFVLLLKLLHRPELTMFRHGAPFVLPGFKSRSQNEGTARFAWCLDSMLKAGSSPAAAIFTAVQAIPNAVIRKEAMRNLGPVRENESLSKIMDRSKIVSYEYVDIIANGEMTGTLPHALAMIRENEVREDERKSNQHKLTIHLGTSIFMGIIVFCFVLALYRAHYTSIFNVFDRE